MIFPIQKPYQAMQQTILADISQVGLLSFLMPPLLSIIVAIWAQAVAL